MRELVLGAKPGVRVVLCLGAHADDIEIGCGGLVLDLIDAYPKARIHWIVLSGEGGREREARACARSFLRGAGRAHVAVQKFRDGFFPSQFAEIKSFFEDLKTIVGDPDLVLTHTREDRHQDHRVISDLTWNTFRNHFVLEYEIPKFDGDLGTPNCFVPLSRKTCTRKVKYLMRAFGTQRDKHWFTEETFKGLMRLRGVECRAEEGYAEAFYTRKMVLGTSGRSGRSS